MIQAPSISTFEDLFNKQDRSDLPEWMHERQTAAFSAFTEAGMPTVKQEGWRQTDVSAISRLPLVEAAAGEHDCSDISWPIADLDGQLVVFVNGRCNSERSHFSSGDVTVATLSSAEGAAAASDAFGSVAKLSTNTFAALNTASLCDGVVVRVAAGVKAAKPIHVVHVTTGEDTAHYPRTLVVAEAGADVTIIESFVGADELRYFTNSVTEISAADGAAVMHVRFQKESNAAYHIGSVDIRAGAGCDVATYAINVGGRLARVNVAAELAGENAECTVNGMYLVGGTQVTDTHTFIDHAVPNCRSHELYKGVLDDKSRGIFTGKILVRKDAQKTDSMQTNRSLLLSDDARVNAQPQLEIYADDVKCSHGATIGELDEQAVFYLRSRGIDHKLARRMLMQTFVIEAVADIPISAVQDEIQKILQDKFDA